MSKRKRVLSDLGSRVRWLDGPPIRLDPGCVPITFKRFRDSVLVLSPVDKLSSLPKWLAPWAQADFLTENNLGNNNGLISARGITYCWSTAIRKFLTD